MKHYYEWKIQERFLIIFDIREWAVGFNINLWSWVYLGPFRICINLTRGPMFGYQDE